VEVEPGVQHLEFVVKILPDTSHEQVTLATYATVWTHPDTNRLIPQPVIFGSRVINNVLQLQDFNVVSGPTASESETFHFHLQVVFHNTTFCSPDPTIINKLPNGGLRISYGYRPPPQA
jgi:hypothetical protein